MKKLQQTLVVGALLVSPLIASPVAKAATCQVGFTGPDSNNLCVSVATYTCAIDNTNNITVSNDNPQTVASGTASTSGNSGAGGAQSGSVTNDNGVSFDFTIENGEGDGDICRITSATIPATPDPTPEVDKEPVPAPVVKAAPVLAKTSADSTIETVATVLGITVGGLALLKLISVLSRRQ